MMATPISPTTLKTPATAPVLEKNLEEAFLADGSGIEGNQKRKERGN
jgi:hypothetical protein